MCQVLFLLFYVFIYFILYNFGSNLMKEVLVSFFDGWKIVWGLERLSILFYVIQLGSGSQNDIVYSNYCYFFFKSVLGIGLCIFIEFS